MSQLIHEIDNLADELKSNESMWDDSSDYRFKYSLRKVNLLVD